MHCALNVTTMKVQRRSLILIPPPTDAYSVIREINGRTIIKRLGFCLQFQKHLWRAVFVPGWFPAYLS